MSRFPRALQGAVVLVLATSTVAVAQESNKSGYYGYGEKATSKQIAGWDIDVRPDGKGLPPGSGSVEDGEYIYEEQCAQCHGSFGEGEGRFPVLAGGEGSLKDPRPQKTIGSFWNHASTLWDYIHRAMPFAQPESLSDDEVYAVTAYVLYLNELVEDDFELNQNNLADIKLPNASNFVPDPRPDVHNTRCMKDCRDPKAISIKSEAPQYVPEATIVGELSAVNKGSTVYKQSCALCHDGGLGGAPEIGNALQWSARINQGTQVLYSHAIDGFQGELGMMPAKGGFAQLSNKEVESAVDYMMEMSQ